jgi:hypothetical protein
MIMLTCNKQHTGDIHANFICRRKLNLFFKQLAYRLLRCLLYWSILAYEVHSRCLFQYKRIALIGAL